jgi:hypothetical protein
MDMRKPLAKAEDEIDGEPDEAAVNSRLTDHILRNAITVNRAVPVEQAAPRRPAPSVLLFILAAPVFLAAIAVSLLSARGERRGKRSLWDRLQLPSATAGRNVRADDPGD